MSQLFLSGSTKELEFAGTGTSKTKLNDFIQSYGYLIGSRQSLSGSKLDKVVSYVGCNNLFNIHSTNSDPPSVTVMCKQFKILKLSFSISFLVIQYNTLFELCLHIVSEFPQ